MRNILLSVLVACYSLSIQASNHDYVLFAGNGIRSQSAANYEKYLFLISDRMARIVLYDLEKKKIIYTLKNPVREEKRGNTYIYHCNQSCFGRERFSPTDYFPLLYISQGAPSGNRGAFLDVIRIIPVIEGGEIVSFTITQLQKIEFPPMNDKNCMGYWPDAVIDTISGYIYTYSCNSRTSAPNYHNMVISKFSLPAIYKDGKLQSVVKFSDKDIIDSFSCGFSKQYAQGGFFRKGKIYIVQGVPSKSFVYFREIDVKKRKLTRTIDMLKRGFQVEPEGCWYYNGYVMLSSNGKGIYKLTGKKYKVK